MKAVFFKIGYFNSLLIGLLFLIWVSVFLIGGIIGAYSWTLIKLILPLIGVFGLFINLIIFIVSFFKKINRIKLLSNTIVNLLMFLPIFMTMNVIPLAYPNNINNTKPSLSANFPLKEETVVGWGGDDVKDNTAHAIWASERWAYDLLIEPYNIKSTHNEDYGIWNKTVYSPVSGIIIAAYDKENDITPGSEDFTSLEGNHVYIKNKKTDTYILLNHLRKGSVSVNVGDKVNPGDLLGRVGNSGATSEPHLHIHHQRQDPTKTLYPVLAEGLPLFFNDIGDNPMPVKDDIIKPKNK